MILLYNQKDKEKKDKIVVNDRLLENPPKSLHLDEYSEIERLSDFLSNNQKPEARENYTTIQLIYDLIVEIQKFSEDLALIFPERLMKRSAFGPKKLAKYWNSKEQTSASRVREIKQNANYLSDPRNYEAFNVLRQNIQEKLGIEKSRKCLQIMDEYKEKKFSGEIFINRLFEELGRVSGDIELTIEEAGIILACSSDFIKNVLNIITNPNSKDYNPKYKFSLERLRYMQDNLMRNFGEKANLCNDLLLKYEKINIKELKEYSLQQYNLKNPHYFQDLDSIEKLYWFGFVEHDGFLVKENRPYSFGLELSKKDKDHILKFTSLIGLDLDKNDIKDRVINRWYKGELKSYSASSILISCKPLYEELQGLGFIGSKYDRKYVPQVVKNLIIEAKTEAVINGIDWKKTNTGKKALAWLYGAYDADGSLNYPAGRLRASSKNYLQEIKSLFGIKGNISELLGEGEITEVFNKEIESSGYYSLYIDVKVFRDMISVYNNGLSRKNPYL